MDFDTDGCYTSPAIGRDGVLNPGMDHCWTKTYKHCREPAMLTNTNAYVRARCNNGWCAHMYGYYFEKDVSVDVICGVGHVHDWEHVIVWVYQDQIKYVAVSEHKGWVVKDVKDVRMEGNHPKIVYHKTGGLTHAFRFANEDDDRIENHSGQWFRAPLVSWNGFPTVELRDALETHDFGKASFALKDSRMRDELPKAKGDFGNVIIFDPVVEDPIAPGIPQDICSPFYHPSEPIPEEPPVWPEVNVPEEIPPTDTAPEVPVIPELVPVQE